MNHMEYDENEADRLGALLSGIGYFIENQLDGRNPGRK